MAQNNELAPVDGQMNIRVVGGKLQLAIVGHNKVPTYVTLSISEWSRMIVATGSVVNIRIDYQSLPPNGGNAA